MYHCYGQEGKNYELNGKVQCFGKKTICYRYDTTNMTARQARPYNRIEIISKFHLNCKSRNEEKTDYCYGIYSFMLIEISLCVCVSFFVIIISLLTKSKPFNKRALTLIVAGFWEGHSSTCTTRIADKLENYGQFYETICCRILHQPNQPLSSHQFQLVSLLVLLGEKRNNLKLICRTNTSCLKGSIFRES